MDLVRDAPRGVDGRTKKGRGKTSALANPRTTAAAAAIAAAIAFMRIYRIQHHRTDGERRTPKHCPFYRE
jgi:hypothetical protein